MIEVRAYIPTIPPVAATELKEKLMRIGGGCTIIPAKGEWLDSYGIVCAEDVEVLEVIVPTTKLPLIKQALFHYYTSSHQAEVLYSIKEVHVRRLNKEII